MAWKSFRPHKCLKTCRCILDIPLCVGADPRHFDPLLAEKATGADWLVQSLQSIIEAGFKMATGQVGDPILACRMAWAASGLTMCQNKIDHCSLMWATMTASDPPNAHRL